MDFVPTPAVFPPERSIFLNRMIKPHIQSRSYVQSRKYTSPVYIYILVYSPESNHTHSGFTSQMSPEYVLCSLDRFPDHI